MYIEHCKLFDAEQAVSCCKQTELDSWVRAATTQQQEADVRNNWQRLILYASSPQSAHHRVLMIAVFVFFSVLVAVSNKHNVILRSLSTTSFRPLHITCFDRLHNSLFIGYLLLEIILTNCTANHFFHSIHSVLSLFKIRTPALEIKKKRQATMFRFCWTSVKLRQKLDLNRLQQPQLQHWKTKMFPSNTTCQNVQMTLLLFSNVILTLLTYRLLMT